MICKELGFGSPLQIASTAHFGSGPGPILLDNLDCKGTEPTILNCSHSGIGVHDCTHFEDAGVACSPPGKTSALYILLRLYGRRKGETVMVVVDGGGGGPFKRSLTRYSCALTYVLYPLFHST